MRQRLVKELRFAADKMQTEEDPARKLYFFSATYGETLRVINWSYDRDLVLLHAVLQHTYQAITSRMQALAGRDRAISFPTRYLDMLGDITLSLADHVEREGSREELLDLLARFSEIGYATTGNGNYQIEKGVLKV